MTSKLRFYLSEPELGVCGPEWRKLELNGYSRYVGAGMAGEVGGTTGEEPEACLSASKL